MRLKIAVSSLILFAACAGQPALAQVASVSPGTTEAAKATPEGLYHQVWQMVHDVYYDPTDHGQDWSRWEHRYDGKMKTMDDSYRAIQTMLASLADPWTRFLDPEAWKAENSAIAAKLFGIGIQMGPDKNHNIVVIAPLEGGPAAKAGMMPMDEIIAVNEKSTKGMSSEAVSQLIRGPLGSQVTVTILRNGKIKKSFKLTRAEIHVKSVETVKMIDNEIGYVRLSTFLSQTAGDEVRDALSQLSPARGIILDLRSNPGGLVTNAIEICNIFLSRGVIVSTIDRHGHIAPTGSVGRPFYTKPLVVLINHGSASASEITSGALHDNDRTKLVGERSFGKGLVQAVNKLQGDCGMNVTIARYLTPSGTDIHKKGITPDYEVNLTLDDYLKARGPWWADPGGLTVKRSPSDLKDIQLKKAVEVLRDNLNNTQSPYEIQLQSPLLKF